MITIIYVDDEPDLLEIGKLFLEEDKEFSVDCVLSGKEALDRISSGHYDVVVSDYQMPKMNGISLLKTVRATFGDIPFILFTGKGREDVVIEAINNGADFYLQKGGDPEAQFAELAHKIRQAVMRKQTERSLHDSERRLSDIIDFLPDATFAIDRSGHVIAWNRVMKELTGRSASEMMGKGDYEYAIPFYGNRRPILIDLVFSPHDEIGDRYSFVREDKGILTAETINATPNGISRVLSGKAAPLFDFQGSVIGAIESIRDITEIKKTEQELQRSEDRYRSIVNDQIEMIMRFTPDGTITFANESFRSFFVPRMSPQEIERMNVRELLRRGNVKKDMRFLAPLTPASPTREIEQAIPDMTGKICWQHWSVRALFDKAGQPVEYQVVGHDITGQKRAEEERNRFGHILDSSVNELYIFDPETLKFIEVNLGARKNLGYSLEELRTLTPLDIKPEFTKESFETLVVPLRGGEREEVVFTTTHKRKDGSLYPVEVHLHLSRAGVSPVFVAIILDITERKRAEEELAFKNAILSTQQETSLYGILIVDENGRIINYNQKFPGIWGIPDALLLSRIDEPVLHHVVGQLADPEAFLARVRYLYDHKEKKSFEELLLKDGRVLERFSAPMLGKEGKYYGRIWYFRDITRRRKSEEILKKSEARFHNLYRNMIEGVALHHLVYDDKGNPVDYIIIETNPAFEKHLGISRENVIGRTSREAYSVTEPPYLERYARVALTGEPDVFETYFPPLDRYFSISAYCPEKGHFATIFEDITERKLAEGKLKESEAKYRELAELLPQGIFELDSTFRITYANQHVQDLFGLTSEDISQGLSALSLIDPSQHGRVRESAQRIIRGSPVEPGEYTALRKDGSTFPALIYSAPVCRGAILAGFRGVIVDISSRKKMEDDLRQKNVDLHTAFEQITATEEELRENYEELRRHEQVLRSSEEKFRVLVENSLDAILITDFDGNLLFANQAAGRIIDETGYETMIGTRNVLEFVAPDSRDDVLKDMSNVAQGIDTHLVNYKLITDKKQVIWVECIGKKVPFGNADAILVSLRDVTERKKTEDHLRESERKFATIFLNNPVALTLVSAEDGKFVEVNEAFLRNTGFEREEVIGNTSDSLGIFVDKNEYARLAFEIREKHHVEGMELQCRKKNGQIRTCRFSSSMIIMGTKPVILSTIEDITEQTTTQSAFQAIVRSMVGTTGVSSLGKIAKNISSWLGADCVMIGEIQPDGQTVKVLSMLLDGEEIPDFYYSLKGTPCDNVVEKGFCLYPDNARQLFPESRDLAGLNIRGYVGTPLRNSAGMVSGILCALSRNPLSPTPSVQEIMDIIAVKAAAEIEGMQMERALEKSRQLLGEAMDMAHLVNWEYDLASGLFTFDDRFYALYGTTAEREGGNLMPAEVYAREFVHPDDRHLVGEEVKRAMTTTDPNYTSALEHRIIRRDGEIRYIVVRIGITKDAEGRIVKTHGANQDITDIRKAEEVVRETEGRYQSLVETSPGIIWEIDPGGRLLYISPIVATIMGYAPKELIEKKISDLIPEEMRSVVGKLMAHFGASLDEPISPFEIIVRHRDGHDIVLEIRPSRIIGRDGNLAGFRGVAFDTTERKKAEEALKRANRQLNLLGSITRHDLLNKITVILGNLKMAERKCTDPMQGEHLKKIRSATSTIKSQIEFTRIYQELGIHEPQWIDLNTVIPYQHVPPGITLDAAVHGIQLLADPMLERVFFNLLDNSVRHGERVTKIRVSSHQSGENLTIVWEDNGRGIAGDEKEQIFERGFGKNTGLGMFLAREILSLTGITIRECGVPGREARFEIAVPKGAYRLDTPPVKE
ncbi:PAS domain S-box protein [uncultured Methanoregula sp.]|uniref:PAS domain S-box protein n=1 Tax=uncultured Methanoregula sp. TaxID=1005933 RepID=UPI002AAC22EF|nr:PAS domain S-box protein [uncultured Methanoregula sp.]